MSDWTPPYTSYTDSRLSDSDQHVTTRLRREMTNNSGDTLELGMVVVADPSLDDAVILADTAAYADDWVGTVYEGADDGEVVIVAWTGIGHFGIFVNGTTCSAGDYLFTSTTAGYADADATLAAGAFGRVITVDADDLPSLVQLFGLPVGSSSGVSDIADLPTANTDTSKVLHPDGAGGIAWGTDASSGGDSAGFTYVLNSADQDVTNAQNQDSTDLQFAVTATKLYTVEALLIFGDGDTSGDGEFRFAVSAGTMDGRGFAIGISTADTPALGGMGAAPSATTGNIVVATNQADLGFLITAKAFFSFRQNTSNGTFKVQFGNNSASGGRVTRLIKGSYIRYKLLN